MEQAFEPILPLLQLEKYKDRVPVEIIMGMGKCEAFEGRRVNGKVCPRADEPIRPKKKGKRKAGAESE